MGGRVVEGTGLEIQSLVFVTWPKSRTKRRQMVTRRATATSRFAPAARLNVELRLPRGPHLHQQLLQGVRALAAGIQPLL